MTGAVDAPGSDAGVAEWTWLLDVCRWAMESDDLDGSASGKEILADGLDWHAIGAMALSSRTLAVLGWAYRRHAVALPAWLAEVAEAALLYNERRAIELRKELERIAAALPSGSPVVVRKGLHMASLYPSPGLRPFVDLDLMAELADVPDVEAALEEAGYVQGRLSDDRTTVTPWERPSTMYYRIATNALPAFVRRIGDPELGQWAVVDIATSLLPPGMGPGPAVSDLVGRAVRQAGLPLPVLADADALIDSCANLYITTTTLHYVHLGRHRRLTNYLDLVSLMRRGVDWDEVRSQWAGSQGLRTAMFVSLANLERLFSGVLPPDVVPTLADELRTPHVVDEVGALDLDAPYRWPCSLHERMFLGTRARGLPPSSTGLL